MDEFDETTLLAVPHTAARSGVDSLLASTLMGFTCNPRSAFRSNEDLGNALARAPSDVPSSKLASIPLNHFHMPAKGAVSVI